MTPRILSAGSAARIATAMILGAGWMAAGAAPSMPSSSSPSSNPPSQSQSAASDRTTSARSTLSQEAMSVDTSKPAGPVALRPEVKHEGDVAYVTGGFGTEGREQTRALGRDMNLELVFARANGAYLADVDVSIAARSGGKLLHVDSADPLLFARLPAGTYDVTASVDGRSIERRVTVPAKGSHTEVFSWPPA